MRAIGYFEPLPIENEEALVEIERPMPVATGRDLLVEIKAVAVNPVDTKVRKARVPQDGQPGILGYDASGVVRSVGPEVSGFAVGDEVFYAGDITRPGTNAEFHLVDERIVGHKPKTLTFAEAAALPLTSITAWEALFDRLKVKDPSPSGSRKLLVVGGAGGVGSIAIQLARQLTDLTVVTTASRPQSQAWVLDLGAHHVVDHSKPMAPQFDHLGIGAPDFVFSTTHTDQHLLDIVGLIAPQGRFLLIDDPARFDIIPFKQKCVSIHWELMFTRPMFTTPDMDEQSKLLNRVADLVDDGRIRSTLTGAV
uniref:zinc-binding alcohol dehydrogenase family protein n=1 Tax=Roseibium sp. TaxID=1936156 RepID=UPI003D09D74F